jgi:hypothetical protein
VQPGRQSAQIDWRIVFAELEVVVLFE